MITAAATPAYAGGAGGSAGGGDGGAGGLGGGGGLGSGDAAGGLSQPTGAGQSGTNGSGTNGGGGGGAGQTFGAGGNGGGGKLGGASAGAGGQGGAGGGGGGASGEHGFVAAGLPAGAASGSAGGLGGGSVDGAGGGGAGGFGAVVTGAVGPATIAVGNDISGGRGGDGGFAGGPVNSDAGGGGGGGLGILFLGTATGLTFDANVNGGDGGFGATSISGAGGGGGGGGEGVVFAGAATGIVINGNVAGGDGGVGTISAFGSPAAGGGGGGAGIVFLNGGSLTVNGSVSGGNGAAGSFGGATGLGGVGISGAGINLEIATGGSVSGGTGGGGQAKALDFTGGANVLRVQGTGAVNGGIGLEGTLDVGEALINPLTLSGPISGGGTLIKTGNNVLTLGGVNTYSGGTTISNGTIEVQGGLALSDSGLVSIANVAGATLLVTDSQTMGSLSGGGTIGGAVSIGSGQALTTGDNAVNDTFAGVISGAGDLIKQGTDTFTLTGASTYTGVTTVDGGTLSLSGASARLGSAAADIQVGSSGAGNLLVEGGAQLTSLDGNVGLGSAGSVTVTGTFSSWTGNFISVGRVDDGTSAIDGRLTVSAGGRVSNSRGFIGSFSKGTATVTGADSRWINSAGLLIGFGAGGTGDLTVENDGTVEASQIEMGNNGGSAAAISVTNFGVLNVGAIIKQGGTATLDFDGGQIQAAASTSNFLAGFGAGDVTIGAGGLRVLTNGFAIGFTSPIDGSGGLTKSNPGELTLSAAATYAGATTVEGGTLKGGATNAFSATSATTVNAGGTLDLGGFGQTIGSLAGAGTLTNSSTTAANLTTGGNNGTTPFSGLIQDGSGPLGLIKTGTGTLTLSGANTYSGGTTINAGTLQFDNIGALGSGLVTLAGGTLRGNVTGTLINQVTFQTTSTLAAAAGETFTQTGQLNISNGATVRFGTATDTGTIVLGAPVASTSPSYAIEINGGTLRAANSILGRIAGDGLLPATSTTVALNATLDFNDQLAVIGNLQGAGAVLIGANPGSFLQVGSGNFSGAIQGAGGLSVQDTSRVADGTLILGGTSTYTGATHVEAGNTLRVNGSIDSSSGVTVDAGGTIGGTGTLPDTVVNGTLSPGNSPGTLTVDGDLTLNAGSTSVFELATSGVPGGGTNDLVNVDGNLTLGGTLQTPGAVSGFYRLFNVTGTISNSFATVPAGGIVVTAVPNQVNLLFSNAGQQVQFWDGPNMTGNGTVDGGTGTWNVANTNWTGAPGNANTNAPWLGQVGVFSGTAGTVTVSGPIAFEGVQFSTDGYTVTGGGLAMTGDSAGNTAASFVNVDGGVTATIDSALTGAGIGLDKLGGGTLVLTGANTYTGPTTIHGGQLLLGAAGNQGSIVGAVANNGAFGIVNADISAISSITNQGVGGGLAETGFFGSTTAGSTTIVNNDHGITSFLADSTAGNATITTNAGGFLQFFATSSAASASITNQAAGGSFAQTIFRGDSSGGHAAITNVGGGITTFDETSTAANATIHDNDLGTTNFAGSGTADHAVITNDDGFTQFVDASTAANATITNSGSGATQFGGKLFFWDASTAANAVIVNNSFGTFQFLENSTAANATITTNSKGVGIFSDNSTAANAKITTNSGGVTFFADNSTGGDARLITNAGGSLDISNLTSGGMTAGSIEGAGNYLLGKNRLTTGSIGLSTEVSGVIADGGDGGGAGGALTKVGAGTLILSGANTYTGGTTISGGTLQIGNGGTTGSIRGDVIDNATLAFDRSHTLEFGGVISGSGAVHKLGAGNLILSGHSTYTGATMVDAGTLSVNGSIAASSLITVNAGGTLGGNGTVGDTTLAGGTLAPGNSIGTLTVLGDLVFGAGSKYAVEVSTVAADRTNVSGKATLSGGSVAVTYLPGSFVTKDYVILDAAGGFAATKFAAVDAALLPGLTTSLVYDPTEVHLVTASHPVGPDFGALNLNQQAVANALLHYFDVNGSLPAEFAALDANGLTLVSGEIAAGAITAGLDSADKFLGALDGQMEMGAGLPAQGSGVSGYAEDDKAASDDRFASLGMSARHDADQVEQVFARRWNVWGTAYGGSEQTDGDAVVGSHDTKANTWGLVGGVSYHVDDTLVGFALGGGWSDFSLSDGLGDGSANTFNAGIYGRQGFGNAYVSGAFAYGFHDVETSRTVFGDTLSGDFDAHTYSGRAEAGYRFDTPLVAVSPYAAFQATAYHLPAYSETGTGPFALNYDSDTTTATRVELGARLDHAMALSDGGLLTLSGRAAWAINGGTDRNVGAAFQSLPGTAFTIDGAEPDSNSLLLDAGAEYAAPSGFFAAATFQGEFSGNVQSYAGKVKIGITW